MQTELGHIFLISYWSKVNILSINWHSIDLEFLLIFFFSDKKVITGSVIFMSRIQGLKGRISSGLEGASAI